MTGVQTCALPIYAPRPVHPRALHEASLSGTGERWPRPGATRTPNARRLKPQGPGATSVRVTGSSKAGAVAPVRRTGAGRGPKRWLENSDHRGPCGGKPINTARGTLERRRTCGFLPDFPRVCWTSRRPARPRTFSARRRLHENSGAYAPRERPNTSSPGLTRRSMKRSSA